jgi:hypothetical protein
MLPGETLLVGEVLANFGDGTASVQYHDGGTQRVRGSGTVGGMVYVRAGRIEGAAPDMTAVTVDV